MRHTKNGMPAIPKRTFTAMIGQCDGWHVGYVREIPWVHSQGKTLVELKENLISALHEAVQIIEEQQVRTSSPRFKPQLLEV